MATNTGYIDFNEAAAPSTPAASKARLYVKSDGLFYSKDDAGTETLVSGGAGGGAVATDAIWDAAGDLAVGSGANTAARLALGNAGGAVSRVNGAVAWNSGTAFPTAATGDRYWRTDLGKEYYYDGTRWLTVHELEVAQTTRTALGSGVAATSTLWNAPTRMAAGDMYLTRFEVVTFVNTTNDGTKYWDITLDKLDSANSGTTIATVTTQSNATATWIEESAAINAVVVGSAHVTFRCVATLVSTATSLLVATRLKYREIAT